MSSGSDDNTVTANPTVPSTANDQRLIIDGLCLKKLDALEEIVVKRLGGGGFGEWWIEGHKTSTDTRHHALQEVFQLERAIEDLNTTLSQQGRAPELLDKEIKANSKATGTMNAKQRDTMRTTVAEEVERQTRDIKIKTERVEARLAVVERENKDLRGMVDSLASKSKKNCDSVAANNSREIRSVAKTIDDFKRQTGDTQTATKEETEGELDSLRNDLKNTKQELANGRRFSWWEHDNLRVLVKNINASFLAVREQLPHVEWPAGSSFHDEHDPKYKEQFPDP